MRKFVLIVICLSLFLSICGCANDQYAVEREFWQIKKQAEKIFKNPAASPPNELERVVARLDNFSGKNPGNEMAVEAGFFVARIYAAKNEFESARKQLKKLIAKYPKSQIVNAEALFLIGKTYELQDKWDEALAQYKKIIADFPLTPRGWETPLYIANYYKAKFQPDKMLAAFGQAVNHYRALAAKYPNTPLAFKAYLLVSSCYSATKDWQNTVNTLNTVLDKFIGFKDKIQLDAVLFEIALIYKKELKDDLKANAALERLIKEFPNSKYISSAKKFLKS